MTSKSLTQNKDNPVRGMLTLLEPRKRVRDKHKFLCACGNITYIILSSFLYGGTKSCGCLRRISSAKNIKKCAGTKGALKHGKKGTVEYSSWSQMRDRCNNANNKNYSYYGERGIKVCHRWDDFSNFLSDMGERPSKSHTLDRIENNKGYYPENCRWATRKEQSRNRRITKIFTVINETKPLSEWADIFNIDYSIVNKRLWRGWDTYKALTTPKRF